MLPSLPISSTSWNAAQKSPDFIACGSYPASGRKLTECADARHGALLPQVQREPKVGQLQCQVVSVAEQHILCVQGVCLCVV